MPRTYTPAERIKRARLVFGGAKKALAGVGDPHGDAAIDRIDDAAEERGYREYAAARDLEERAKNELAAAKAKERASRGPERGTARDARRTAEQRLRDAQRGVRKLG